MLPPVPTLSSLILPKQQKKPKENLVDNKLVYFFSESILIELYSVTCCGFFCCIKWAAFPLSCRVLVHVHAQRMLIILK